MTCLNNMKIVIFDLDGTLANINHRLHFINQNTKDWNSFSKDCIADTPKQAVIQTAKALHQSGHPIWILSGRSASVERETRAWLKQYDIPYNKLLMRPVDNSTPDHELKRHWIGEYHLKSRTLCAYDDRQRVVDMWREEGFECFQVAVSE